MTNEVKQQFTLRITQANPTQLVVILYEMADVFLKEAAEVFQKEDMAAYKEGIRKARGCINELIQSLHMEYDPAPKLLRLYLFCIRRLAYAEVRKEAEVLKEVSGILGKLKEAYGQVAAANPAAPVMSNTQTVYSGLTYGKSADLAEDVSGQSLNRGMLI